MNLGQAIARGLVVVEQSDDGKSSPLTVEEAKRCGFVTVRKHERVLWDALEVGVDDRQSKQRCATADQMCHAIQECGRGLTWGELKGRCGGLSAWVIRNLVRKGRMIRTGETGAYVYSLPEISRGINVRPLAAETVAELVRSGDLVSTGKGTYSCTWSEDVLISLDEEQA
jgi:hypothetical protein